MRLRGSLFLLSAVTFGLFIIFSYTVAKEYWQQIDFDTMVKLQDKISRDWDSYFSYFSLIGSAEVTISMALILAGLNFLRLRWVAFIGWLMIVPASFFEVFGKLFIFHPGPPVLFHRNILETQLPSFYVQTNFSYPSGHMTRSVFLITAFLTILLFSKKYLSLKLPFISFLLAIGFIMTVTRVYLGEHWLSDVIGGGLLGVSSGLFAAFLIVRKK